MHNNFRDSISLHVITDTPDSFCNIPYIEFTLWEYGGFKGELGKADICVLSHFGPEASLAKTVNKMVTSIMLGVPVVASDTPEYSKLAKICGLERFLFSDKNTLIKCVNYLLIDRERRNYLERAQKKLRNLYSIENILNKYLKEIILHQPGKLSLIKNIKVLYAFSIIKLNNIIHVLW